MIACILVNLESSVDLLHEHDRSEGMGESHFGHGELEEGRIFKILVQAERTADDERNSAVLHRNFSCQEFRKLLAVELFALNAEGNEQPFKMFADEFSFLCEGFLNFLFRRIVREADGRELNEMEFAERVQAFEIEFLSLYKMRFFLFSDGNQVDDKH